MSIYVNNGDGERELREIETPHGVVTSVSVNHGDGDGEQKVWTHASQDGIIEEGLLSVYDAQALSGYSDGDPVNEWPDTEGNYLLTAASGDEPTYRVDSYQGNPALEFTGGEYFEPAEFDEVETQPYTYYAVLEFEGGSGRSYPFYGLNADGDRGFIDLNDSENFEMWAGSPGTFQFPQTTDPVVVACVFDGSNSVFRIDDEEQSGDPGEMDQRGHSISHARNPMRGSIAEVRVYEVGHQKTERNEVVSYLAEKHDLPLAYQLADTEPNEYTGGATIDLQPQYDNEYDTSFKYNGVNEVYQVSSHNGGGIEFQTVKTHKEDVALRLEYGSHTRVANIQKWLSDHSSFNRAEEQYSEIWVNLDDIVMTSNGTHRFYWVGYNSGPCASGVTCTPSGDDGWSIVTSIAGPDRATVSQDPYNGDYEIRIGIYHMDRMSDPNPTGATTGGGWTKLGYYWKMNKYTGGNADRNGIVALWIDDEHVWTRDDLAFVTSDGEGGTHFGPLSYQNYEDLSGMETLYEGHRTWIEDDIPSWVRNLENPS
ncbi:hypothetical protein OB919_19155 [Halobacteria archaeon AArc-curdl1]|uniref:Uncharacterized protein n=1 Tax=Natronosalvus hydrolyticus TaxID=2979988 RepID=A0AAP2ZBF6_9EURY|nr:hypothetical protein [Halobacteria archaeon AArc-curdl1]